MFWKIRCWLISLRPEVLFPGKFDFRVDFWRVNPRARLLSDYVIALQLRIAHLFERLHFRIYWSTERVLRNEKGMVNIEATIIMACFVIITVVASLAMWGQSGNDKADIEEVVSTIEAQAEEIGHEACVYLCEIDYNNEFSNIVEYQQCLSDCSE